MMNFNDEELAAIAQAPPVSCTREGLLYTTLTVKKHAKRNKSFDG